MSFRNNYSGGALEYYSIDVVSGGTVTAFEAPSREGYTFDGWYPNADGSGTEYAFTDSITADSVYYAQWTPATYTVTWPTQSGFTLGGTLPATAAYGDSITFTVTLASDYNDNAPQAASNGLGLVPTAISGDEYTYVISNITGDTTVTVIATADATPTYTVSFRNNYSGGALEYYSIDVVSGGTVYSVRGTEPRGLHVRRLVSKRGRQRHGVCVCRHHHSGRRVLRAVDADRIYNGRLTATAACGTQPKRPRRPRQPQRLGRRLHCPPAAADDLNIGGTDVTGAVLSLDGYTLIGWATSAARAGAGTVDYALGDTYEVTGADTLYAVWEAIPLATYTVSYPQGEAADGYTLVPFESTSTVSSGGSFKFYIDTDAGYTIDTVTYQIGSAAAETAAAASGLYTITNITDDTVITVTTTKQTYTVSYDGNGSGDTIAADTKTYGEDLTLAGGGFTRGRLYAGGVVDVQYRLG